MEERTYKVMGGSGALNIAVGVVALVVGVASGVLLLISGAKLLAGRRRIAEFLYFLTGDMHMDFEVDSCWPD